MPFDAVDAVLVAAAKRKLADAAAGEDLRRRMRSAGVADVSAVRRWLEVEARLGGDLVKRLLPLVPPPDRVFGAYRPLAHLAEGGMGSVWLSADAAGATVVVKTLRGAVETGPTRPFELDDDGSIWIGDGAPAPPPPPKREASPGSGSAGMDRRFEREARITRELRHPHLVRCLDHGACSDGTLYLVLEYVPNGDLRELVAERGALPEAQALEIVRQAAEGLAAAHARHLIHRDIKPHNIFVAADGTAKLADFGFARTTRADRTQLTMQGTVIGSPAYMSPEQIDGGNDLDIRSDIYALGAVLHFCLAGKPPYTGSIIEMLHQHRIAPVPDLRALAPEASERTAAIVRRCLAKRREERHPDPQALLADLRAALAALPTGAAQPSPIAAVAAATTAAATLVLPPTATEPARSVPPHLQPTPLPNAVRSETAALVRTHEATPEPTGRGEAEPPPPALPGDALVGDIALGLGDDWLCLAPERADEPTLVFLYARPRLVLGKFKDPSVDICLRNYPVDQHLAACQRLSRSHLALEWDRARGACTVADLGSSNGTTVDGERLLARQPVALSAGVEHIADLAKVVVLRLRTVPNRDRRPEPVVGRPVQAQRQACGLESAHTVDAVVLTRPRNRPELAYVQVLRRLSVGGPGADLVLANAVTPARCELGLIAGRWIWRPDRPTEAWRPLTADAALDCGGIALRPRAGTLADF